MKFVETIAEIDPTVPEDDDWYDEEPLLTITGPDREVTLDPFLTMNTSAAVAHAVALKAEYLQKIQSIIDAEISLVEQLASPKFVGSSISDTLGGIKEQFGLTQENTEDLRTLANSVMRVRIGIERAMKKYDTFEDVYGGVVGAQPQGSVEGEFHPLYTVLKIKNPEDYARAYLGIRDRELTEDEMHHAKKHAGFVGGICQDPDLIKRVVFILDDGSTDVENLISHEVGHMYNSFLMQREVQRTDAKSRIRQALLATKDPDYASQMFEIPDDPQSVNELAQQELKTSIRLYLRQNLDADVGRSMADEIFAYMTTSNAEGGDIARALNKRAKEGGAYDFFSEKVANELRQEVTEAVGYENSSLVNNLMKQEYSRERVQELVHNGIAALTLLDENGFLVEDMRYTLRAIPLDKWPKIARRMVRFRHGVNEV